jgi:hypothetical protein
MLPLRFIFAFAVCFCFYFSLSQGNQKSVVNICYNGIPCMVRVASVCCCR